jgi:hypothetical protein
MSHMCRPVLPSNGVAAVEQGGDKNSLGKGTEALTGIRTHTVHPRILHVAHTFSDMTQSGSVCTIPSYRHLMEL